MNRDEKYQKYIHKNQPQGRKVPHFIRIKLLLTPMTLNIILIRVLPNLYNILTPGTASGKPVIPDSPKTWSLPARPPVFWIITENAEAMTLLSDYKFRSVPSRLWNFHSGLTHRTELEISACLDFILSFDIISPSFFVLAEAIT